jgi:uncharacterized protein YjiS (DUF1127 family)
MILLHRPYGNPTIEGGIPMATATARAAFHAPHALPRIAATVGDTLKLWRRRMRERAELARWNDRDMHDAGVSRATVQVEMGKPFWRG